MMITNLSDHLQRQIRVDLRGLKFVKFISHWMYKEPSKVSFFATQEEDEKIKAFTLSFEHPFDRKDMNDADEWHLEEKDLSD